MQKHEERMVDLVTRTRAGDRLAYKQLLEACVPMIRQSVRFHLARYGNQAFAEDIAQEVLLAIHQKLHTYDDKQAFLPWLRAIARHKAIDFMRKNQMKTVSIDAEDAPEIEDTTSQSETTAARDLDILLKKLKPPAGDIIYMLKIEGMTIAELAKKFKLRESNIKVIVHRGLAKLSQMVLQENIGAA